MAICVGNDGLAGRNSGGGFAEISEIRWGALGGKW